jgi:cytochrome oxidase assembly protein ShyY1
LGLAFWQLQRAAYKTELSERLAKLQQAGAVNVEQLRGLTSNAADGLYLTVEAHRFSNAVWLLDNQIVHGRIGYDVIAPFQLNTGDEIFLVDLGWVAAPLNRNQLPKISVPARFTIQGILRTHVGGILLGQNIEDGGRWPKRIQQIDINVLSADFKQPVYKGIIHQLQNSPYVIHYQTMVMSPERHRAYALQWILLALAVIVIALAASLKNDRSAIEESINVRQ